jgi:hypothetical protein
MTDNDATAPDTIVLVHGFWATPPGMTIATNSRETVRLTHSPFRLPASGHDATEIRSSTHLRHRGYSRSA